MIILLSKNMFTMRKRESKTISLRVDIPTYLKLMEESYSKDKTLSSYLLEKINQVQKKPGVNLEVSKLKKKSSELEAKLKAEEKKTKALKDELSKKPKVVKKVVSKVKTDTEQVNQLKKQLSDLKRNYGRLDKLCVELQRKAKQK